MFPSRAWLRHAGRFLAERLDRLRATLDTLRERLRAAVCEAIGQTVAGAVHDAVHAVLGATTSHEERPSHYYLAPDASRPWWRDPEERPWADDREHWYAGEEEEPSPKSPPAPPQPAPTRLRVALVVGCELAAWWLRRWTGRCSLLAALTIGLLSATFSHVTDPGIAAGIGLVGSIVSSTRLGDTFRFGATALRPVRCP